MKTIIVLVALIALINTAIAGSDMYYGYSVTLASTGAVRSTWGGGLSVAPAVLPCSGSVAPYCTFNMTDTKLYKIGFTGSISVSASSQLIVKLNGANWKVENLAPGNNIFNNYYYPSQSFNINDKIELWYNGTAGTTFTTSNAVFRGFFVGFYFLAPEVSARRDHNMEMLLEAN